MKKDTERLPPVIAIDGPSASGKGTLAKAVADRLKFAYLDSGAIYRALAKAARDRGIKAENEAEMTALARELDLVFEQNQIFLNGIDVSKEIRSDEMGAFASKIAGLPRVRSALLERQRRFRAWPGLVADGRDMGSVVFKDADLKFYLTASVEIRAERRYKQLNHKENCVSLDEISMELAERDQRDRERMESPLHQTADAILIDNSNLSIEECVKIVMSQWQDINTIEDAESPSQ